MDDYIERLPNCDGVDDIPVDDRSLQGEIIIMEGGEN